MKAPIVLHHVCGESTHWPESFCGQLCLGGWGGTGGNARIGGAGGEGGGPQLDLDADKRYKIDAISGKYLH
jgi:hypothetical protein